MTLKGLCEAVNDALNGQPDGPRLKRLARHAAEIASLTGWAPGVIDPQGRFAKICMDLETKARNLYERTGQYELAEVHDSLAELRETVARHDNDLKPSAADEDGDEAPM